MHCLLLKLLVTVEPFTEELQYLLCHGFQQYLEFFFKVYCSKCNDENPFNISKLCLKCCHNVRQVNPPFCIHHHIYKAQYTTFWLLNICTVLYNYSWPYTHTSLAPGTLLML